MGERDGSNLNVAYGSVSVEDLQGNAMALDDPDEAAELVAVQFWNPGCANPTCWTGKNSKKVWVTNAEGEAVSVTKREKFLRYVIDRLITGGSEMMGLVDCGIHEEGVEGVDVELQTIVNGFNDQKPDIQVHKFKSYLHEFRRDSEH